MLNKSSQEWLPENSRIQFSTKIYNLRLSKFKPKELMYKNKETENFKILNQSSEKSGIANGKTKIWSKLHDIEWDSRSSIEKRWIILQFSGDACITFLNLTLNK